jgi:cell fate regulator YaaT (PSP1 superfamily)
LDATYNFDRSQLLFRFLSDERVDFRQLAKDLGYIFKTRIELRQIGIRDKAKELGGFGPCGRILCCNAFLTSFDSVSINMAKNQSLALNPTKINGVCGRLLCCLNYENEQYIEAKKRLPEIGSTVKVGGKDGKVISINYLLGKYRVSVDEEVIEVDVNDSKKSSS